MATLQLLKTEPTGLVFSDPAVPGLTIRFRNTSSMKTLNGVSVKNLMAEIICNDANSVTVGGVAAIDPVSIRIRVSGAAESATRIGVLLEALRDQIDNWNSEHFFQGFNPTTAPVVPKAT